MDERPDDEVEGPPPIGYSSQDLAVMLSEVLADIRTRQDGLDDETIMFVIAAAIEANNRQVYQDLVSMGVIVEVDEDDDDGGNGLSGT